MAAIDLSEAVLENQSTAETYSIPFVNGHTKGTAVRPNGAAVTALTQTAGGIIIRVGDAHGNMTLVLRKGILRGVKGAGAAANAEAWMTATGGADDTRPTGAAGTAVTKLGDLVSATRMLVNVTKFEKGSS